MSSQRYERISSNDQDEQTTPTQPEPIPTTIPSSPPPSFHSRSSSPTSRHFLNSEDPMVSDADRTLADTFDDGEDSDAEGNNGGDDRQRLMHSTSSSLSEQRVVHDGIRPAVIQRMVTQLPTFSPATAGYSNVNSGVAIPNRFSSANDGVFANLNAKPESGEKIEEQPPTYEQAAADATPPYWETMVLTPGMSSDEIYVDGLPVGSLFSFVWNGMISMSFQLVGFLLTYLLHTTHAAKNGSKAGLGITTIQWGFYMRGGSSNSPDTAPTDPQYDQPPDPNSHDFDPSKVAAAAAATATSTTASGLATITSSDWLAYALMILGWFILIRAVSDFFRARRHEQLVLQSPNRGLGMPVVAEDERAEEVV